MTPDHRSTREDGITVDGTRFDSLIKRLSTTPLTRATVLRGLGASAAILIGVTLAAEPEDAEGRKLGKVRRKRICVCSTSNAPSCKQVKVIKKKAKKLLKRNPCNYRGRCQGVSGCPATTGVPGGGTTTVNNTFLPANQGTPPTGGGGGGAGTCVVGTGTGCPAGHTCVLDVAGVLICLPNNLVITCTSDAQCPSGFCANIVNGVGICLPCGTLRTTICGNECCVLGVCSSILNVCVLPERGGLLNLGL